MDRYSKITNKNQREIVLLKAFPCIWGKCRFCDYIEDNSNQKDEMLRLNHEILSQVTGEFGVLEVINSGSCFELPKETLEEIRILIQTKKIKKLFFESFLESAISVTKRWVINTAVKILITVPIIRVKANPLTEVVPIR